MRKLVIDPVVAAILGPSEVSRVADMREHTEAVCLICGGAIRPEDPAPATVLVGVSEDTVLYIRLAHENCAPSRVYDIDAELRADLQTEVDFVAYPILRAPPVIPRATIVFEFARTIRDDLGQDLLRHSYLRRGWEPVTDTFERVTAAAVDGLCVRLRDDQIVVDEADGEIIAFVSATAPPGWWEAGAEHGCLLLYGAGLGLDRFSFERLDSALQVSGCVAATARVDRSAHPEGGASTEEASTRTDDTPGRSVALFEEDDEHREILSQSTDLLAHAHIRLVTGYLARYKRDPLGRARRAGLSPTGTADLLVREMGHSPEAKLLLSYVEANRASIGEALWHAVQTGSDPYGAVAAWVGDHEIKAYAEVRAALRQEKEPPL